ncbi:hypothetical protein ABVK25_011410 [Lepraria finkii]|uniref:Mitochondrial ribosomal protein S35 n=1 Tax=Lepraria finkii TaxID=1340010 RepID=A0ABR4ARU7_9LECA
MSMKRLSPTANLLRTSRLFSLPPPLPRPSSELTATETRDSDTATLPYPTHASIQTTETSLGRGDWGLKRPLPLKSTTGSSTPIIRIDNIDSIDHITDFNSAADHVLTLRKWQELDMPISLVDKKKTASGNSLKPLRSVFESRYDNTQLDSKTPSKDLMREPKKERWKYKGPWIAGQTDGEFKAYVEKSIKRKKLDFREFVREQLVTAKAAARRREAIEEGEDLDSVEVTIPEEELDSYMKRLRNDETGMHKLLEEFLDLPRDEVQASGGAYGDYDEKGPPTTHPSAGLSYLRTASRILNHPDFGPQEYDTLVPGRVIAPQKIQTRTQARALIGVAGVVGSDSKMTFNKTGELPGVANYDPDIPGGAKIWVRPRRAGIDSHGRIELLVDRASKNAVHVAQGLHSEEPKLPEAAIAAAQERATPTLTSPTPRTPRSSQGYGVEDMDVQNSSGRAIPFLGLNDQPNLNDLLRGALVGGPKKAI